MILHCDSDELRSWAREASRALVTAVVTQDEALTEQAMAQILTELTEDDALERAALLTRALAELAAGALSELAAFDEQEPLEFWQRLAARLAGREGA
ncbi:MAG: hypothetical protein ABR592_01955 [Nitriliruptorales bacterium]